MQTDATEAEDKRAQIAILADMSIDVPGAIRVFRWTQVRVGMGWVTRSLSVLEVLTCYLYSLPKEYGCGSPAADRVNLRAFFSYSRYRCTYALTDNTAVLCTTVSVYFVIS